MHTRLEGNRAHYQLPIGKQIVEMNALVGKPIQLQFNAQIVCSNCGRITKKSYSQGYCYPCCRSLARCDLCIMKPETCHYHLGTCRESAWGLAHCFKPHIIYLANSSGVKVGITSHANTPSRWIDQGAVSALPILSVANRLQSGQIEVALKAFVADKTNWRKMLKNEVSEVDLVAVKNTLLGKIPQQIARAQATEIEGEPLAIHYPVIEYPRKISSLNFDKTPVISGILQGIKGQYLLLDCGVLNIRKFGAYNLTLTY